MREPMTFGLRVRAMLAGWGSVGVVYLLSHLLQGPGHVLHETMLDRMIPFNAMAVWPYLSFFVLVPMAFLATDATRVPWLTRAMQGCALVCGCIFILWPTTLYYPDMAGHGLSGATLRALAALDSGQNCFPSLHAALTLLSVWALLDRRRPWRSLIALACGAAICYSIIALRRHLAIDLTGGLAVGLAIGGVWRARLAARSAPEGVAS